MTSIRLYWMRIAFFLVALSVTGCVAQTQQEPISKQGESLKTFLQGYLGKPYPQSEQEGSTRYSVAFVDLTNGGMKEAIIYVTGRDWCGTGGCTMLILAPEGASYRVVTKIPAVRLPIRVLATKTNGWRDIAVVARKDANEPLYEAILSFDGKSYPSSTSEAGESNGKVHGRIVMSPTAKGRPLY